MLVGLAILIAFYISIYITSPFITLFHELGHALAYLILTKQKNIDVFIGSYGNKDTKLNFKVGKLHFYVKQSFPFFSSRGQCQASSYATSYITEIIILLAGPFFSFFMASMLGVIAFNTDIHGAIKLYIFALIICSLISLISNLLPRTNRMTGNENDGKRLLFVLKLRKGYDDYMSACKSVLNDEYADACEKLLKIIAVIPNEEKVLRLLSNSLIMLNRYEEAGIYFEQLRKISPLSADEYITLGYTQSILGKRMLATENYQHALDINPEHELALNNLAYEYTFVGRYDEAETLLNRAIELKPEFAYSYNNLGYVRVLMGNLEDGKQLIDKSMVMRPNNAYAYKHLGVYYLKIKDSVKANANFKRALELDKHVVMENYFEELKKLEEN